ncbi:MAG: RNA polymerase sigma factor [Planctomycetota bacterium]|jgi:RNA polymerase sigma-70 factor (ECF subfamily)
MGYDRHTDMGGERERFLTTQWSLIENIQTGQDQDKLLISFLLEQYWKPVYCYLRRSGYDNEHAKDLTQAFFHEVVLNRDLVGRADKAKGRFRSFLLHALKQYTTKQNLKERARKRIPKEKMVSLDVVEPPALPESITQVSVEESFNYAWISALMERVLSCVRAECAEKGMKTHWKLFYERVVRPVLTNCQAPSLAHLCQAQGIRNTQNASNMIVTVKRRFRVALEKNVRRTLLDGDQAPEEIEELLHFFRKSAQGSE